MSINASCCVYDVAFDINKHDDSCKMDSYPARSENQSNTDRGGYHRDGADCILTGQFWIGVNSVGGKIIKNL